jgi:uncharacterized protein
MVNINRKLVSSLIIIMMLIFVLNPIIAKGEALRVFDDAYLFTEEEIKILSEEASNISSSYDMDIIIVTTDDANGKSARDFGDDYFDNNGFGLGPDLDGILFLIDMDNREVYISTSGDGIRYLTDERLDNVIEEALDSGLGEGDYYGGAMGFLSGTKKYLQMGIPSDQYTQDESVKKENSLTFMEGIMSLITGLLASAGFFFGTKSKYKMKSPVKAVNFRENSIVNFTKEDNKLIDTVLTNKKIAKPSSDSGKSTTHESASGKTHGGKGAKF